MEIWCIGEHNAITSCYFHLPVVKQCIFSFFSFFFLELVQGWIDAISKGRCYFKWLDGFDASSDGWIGDKQMAQYPARLLLIP
jgi:hypothetical protein